jgi:hypothetical protein
VTYIIGFCVVGIGADAVSSKYLLDFFMVLRKVLGPKRKWQEDGRDCILRSVMVCAAHQI